MVPWTHLQPRWQTYLHLRCPRSSLHSRGIHTYIHNSIPSISSATYQLLASVYKHIQISLIFKTTNKQTKNKKSPPMTWLSLQPRPRCYAPGFPQGERGAWARDRLGSPSSCPTRRPCPGSPLSTEPLTQGVCLHPSYRARLHVTMLFPWASLGAGPLCPLSCSPWGPLISPQGPPPDAPQGPTDLLVPKAGLGPCVPRGDRHHRFLI